MNDLTKANLPQPSKSTVAMFVQDAMDMEVSIFTLKNTAQKTAEEAVKIKERAEGNLSWRENVKKEKEANYEKCIAERNWHTKYTAFKEIFFPETIGAFFKWLFGVLFLYGALYGFTTAIVSTITPNLNVMIIFQIYTVSFLGLCALIYLIVCLYKKRKHKWHLENHDSNIERSHTELEAAKEALEAQKKESKIGMSKSLLLSQHAEMLENQAKIISENLKNHYSLGIIPPDYRDMVRVTYINRAFRNDQVDTMREATLLCDRDVHHEIIKGALVDIATSLHSISDTLISINTNIDMLSADICNMVEAQNKTLAETKSARYAAEAVKTSTDRLVMYEEMKRNGTY